MKKEYSESVTESVENIFLIFKKNDVTITIALGLWLLIYLALKVYHLFKNVQKQNLNH